MGGYNPIRNIMSEFRIYQTVEKAQCHKTNIHRHKINNGYSRKEGFMTKSPVVSPEKEPRSFTKSFKLNIEKTPDFRVRIFKPPESDSLIKNYYYFTEICKE